MTIADLGLERHGRIIVARLTCATCGGDGSIDPAGYRVDLTCPTCNGACIVTRHHRERDFDDCWSLAMTALTEDEAADAEAALAYLEEEVAAL